MEFSICVVKYWDDVMNGCEYDKILTGKMTRKEILAEKDYSSMKKIQSTLPKSCTISKGIQN